jgi:hypothetical protein
MSIRAIYATAIFFALGLLLPACASDDEPHIAADRPPTHSPQPPVASNQLPTTSPQPPTASAQPPAPALPDLGLAPEITDELWLNTDRPLPLASLRGKVVLVEFWTFG